MRQTAINERRRKRAAGSGASMLAIFGTSLAVGGPSYAAAFTPPAGTGLCCEATSCSANEAATHVRRKTRWQHVSFYANKHGDDPASRPSNSNRSAKRIDNVRRIFAISDLHTDSEANMQWLTERCTIAESEDKQSRLTPGPSDALIIAGDISHDLGVIRETLSTITTNLQCHTFFIPGNHEAWIGGRKMDGMGIRDSFDKLERVVEVCDELGVHTSAKLVGCSTASCGDGEDNHDAQDKHPVWIVPIWSWYDGTLALPGCEDLSTGLATWPWVDFKRCEWGEEYVLTSGDDDNEEEQNIDARFKVPGYERVPSQELTKLFLSWNEPALDAISESLGTWAQEEEGSKLHPTSTPPGMITFSHFLPSQQTLPDWKIPSSDVFRREEWLDHPVPDVSAKFAYVAGSELIDEQIRSIDISGSSINKQIHVFGHSHRPKDFVLDGIRYIHNPVGKPVEREMHMIDSSFDFQLIWDCLGGDNGGGGGGQVPAADGNIIRYWEQYGGGVELLAENMAKRRRMRRKHRSQGTIK